LGETPSTWGIERAALCIPQNWGISQACYGASPRCMCAGERTQSQRGRKSKSAECATARAVPVCLCLSVVCLCVCVPVCVCRDCVGTRPFSLPSCRTLGKRLPVPHLPNTRAPYACTSTEHSRHTYRCQWASVLTHWHASSTMHRRHAQARVAPARAPPARRRVGSHPARGRCGCSRMHQWPRRVHGDPAPA
jgi:hypothetical protein